MKFWDKFFDSVFWHTFQVCAGFICALFIPAIVVGIIFAIDWFIKLF